jgi:hypothetical protein
MSSWVTVDLGGPQQADEVVAGLRAPGLDEFVHRIRYRTHDGQLSHQAILGWSSEKALDQCPEFALAAQGQTQHFQKHLYRQQLGDLRDEIAFALWHYRVNELIGEQADFLLEREDGLGPKDFGQRRSIFRVLRGVSIDGHRVGQISQSRG